MNLTDKILSLNLKKKFPEKLPLARFDAVKCQLTERHGTSVLLVVRIRQNQYSDTQTHTASTGPPDLYIKRAPLVQFLSGCEMALLAADRGVGGAIHPTDLWPTEK